MTKYSYSLLVCCALLFGGCQSVEQLSIDYMLPADISFPADFKEIVILLIFPGHQEVDILNCHACSKQAEI